MRCMTTFARDGSPKLRKLGHHRLGNALDFGQPSMGNAMYNLRPATPDDYDFLYDLLVATMKEYVDALWGWEDAYQQQRFRNKFIPQQYQIITVDQRDVGAMAVERDDAQWFLAEIQILPAHQNDGIGTLVIEDLVRQARQQDLPTALQVLKINPARRLYERLGFYQSGETETHIQMLCPAEG